MHCSGQALPSWIASRVPPETLVFNCAFQVFFIRAFPPFPGILQPSSSCKAEPRLPPPPDCAPAPRRGSCIAVVVQHALGCLTRECRAPHLLLILLPLTFNSACGGRQAGKQIATIPKPALELTFVVVLGLKSSFDCKLICCALSLQCPKENGIPGSNSAHASGLDLGSPFLPSSSRASLEFSVEQNS